MSVCLSVYLYSRTTGNEAVREQYTRHQCNKCSKNNVPIWLKRPGDTDTICLESTGLVPSPVGDVDTGTTPAPSMFRSGITDSQGQQTGHNPPTSRMGYLRERFRGQNLSEEAHQRDTNPISGDSGDIDEVFNHQVI